MRRALLGALSGLLAAVAALSLAELVSGMLRPEASPVTVVGGAVIDRTPPAVKDWAIENFGTNDKLVLKAGIFTLLALFALTIGVLSTRARRLGAAGVLLFGVFGTAAALSRPNAEGTDVLPSLIGGIGGALLLYVLAGRLGAAEGGLHLGRFGRRRGTAGPRATDPGTEKSGTATPAAEDSATGTSGTVNPEVETEGSGATDATDATGTAGTTGATGTAGATAAGSGTEAAEDGGSSTRGPGFDRRGFVLTAAIAAVASTGAGLLGRHLNAGGRAEAAASRATVRLPKPSSPARPVPAGAQLDVRGISEFVTANDDFYRIDTALEVPRVDSGSWRLRIHGKGVRKELDLSFDDLLRRSDVVERVITLTCVSNEVGGKLAGTARWTGVPLANVLREAGVVPPGEGGPADQLVARSVDGMTIGTPVDTVMDGRDALLAFGMNGEPLPFTHGFPVRMIVPGLYGYVSACKWLQDLELSTFDDFDAYWVRRTWSAKAPIKTQSRIDTPRPFASPRAGTIPVAGVAWAQHRGIAKVEVRVDGGDWSRADLADEAGKDTWRQWVWEWPAEPGSHTLEVRATDGTGATQTEKRQGTVPNGATGWHSVVVDVA